MTPVVLTVVLSGCSVLVLAIIYRVEEARQRRFLAPIRLWCDRVVERSFCWLQTGLWRQYVVVLRWWSYRLWHVLLQQCLHLVRRIVVTLESILRRNRVRAKRLSHEQQSAYLTSLQTHKEQLHLSETKRQELKRLH